MFDDATFGFIMILRFYMQCAELGRFRMSEGIM